MLEIDALTVGYPGRGGQGGPVLTDVSLRVDRGEILALVGESGCGKSTLARTAVGLLTPDRGAVRVAGADVHRRRGGGRHATCGAGVRWSSRTQGSR
ncbi:ATP-binding cassette domain-containing protein [Streptomyces iakyrus]|uniref:ATP-binding cassette domain-containing protein n=1 Tax=Streptomyces iakyrus TaxID=68219 RepID=UPI00381AABD0